MGAGNYPDAVLLLQLAKMETPTAYEARYGLGLLYHAANNLKTAAINYNFISVANFHSQFFDFQIDTQKIHSFELVNKNNGNPEDNPPSQATASIPPNAQNQGTQNTQNPQESSDFKKENNKANDILQDELDKPVTNPLLDA